MQHNNPIHVLLVDDSWAVLTALEAFLAQKPELMVVGRARSGDEALQQARRTHPELVLMDWSMPGMTGLEAALQLKGQPQPPCVILLTLHDYHEYQAAAAIHIDGFLPKELIGERLLPLIEVLFPDRAWTSRAS